MLYDALNEFLESLVREPWTLEGSLVAMGAPWEQHPRMAVPAV